MAINRSDRFGMSRAGLERRNVSGLPGLRTQGTTRRAETDMPMSASQGGRSQNSDSYNGLSLGGLAEEALEATPFGIMGALAGAALLGTPVGVGFGIGALGKVAYDYFSAEAETPEAGQKTAKTGEEKSLGQTIGEYAGKAVEGIGGAITGAYESVRDFASDVASGWSGEKTKGTQVADNTEQNNKTEGANKRDQTADASGETPGSTEGGSQQTADAGDSSQSDSDSSSKT